MATPEFGVGKSLLSGGTGIGSVFRFWKTFAMPGWALERRLHALWGQGPQARPCKGEEAGRGAGGEGLEAEGLRVSAHWAKFVQSGLLLRNCGVATQAIAQKRHHPSKLLRRFCFGPQQVNPPTLLAGYGACKKRVGFLIRILSVA